MVCGMATILCIDDNENILQLHRALLKSNGYRVLVALDGPSGIATTRSECVDAVVLDFNLPGMAISMKNNPRRPSCSGAEFLMKSLSLSSGTPTPCCRKPTDPRHYFLRSREYSDPARHTRELPFEGDRGRMNGLAPECRSVGCTISGSRRSI
jgi:hypothetical protein